jgi:hypothetical protein
MKEFLKSSAIVLGLTAMWSVPIGYIALANRTDDTDVEPISSWEIDTMSDVPDETSVNVVESDYVDTHGTSECTYDCSGHSAGYEWGERYEICDTEYDNGNSESFNEGVRQWAEDNCFDRYEYYEDPGWNP